MKNKSNIVVRVGEKTYRVCYAKPYMLSKCFYCAFNCQAEARFRPPSIVMCCRDDTFYFKEVNE